MVSLPESDLGSTLRSFWGKDWPVVQEKLRAKGLDEHTPFHLKPWDESALELREEFCTLSQRDATDLIDDYVEWPDDLGMDWVRAHFDVPESFDEGDLYLLAEAGREHTEAIRQMAAEYVAGIQAAMKASWDSGQFVHAPFSTELTPRPPDERRGGFFSRALTSSGWAIGMTLFKADHPDLVGLADSLERQSRLRNSKIAALLNRHK